MGKCPNCGKGGWRLETLECSICGKEGCDECFIFLFTIVDQTRVLEEWYACSDRCLDGLAKEIEGQISSSDIPVDKWDQIPPIHFVTERAVLSEESKRLFPDVIKKLERGKQLHVYFSTDEVPSSFSDLVGEREDKVACKSNLMWTRLFQYTSLLKAKHFETLREYENAARVYKSLGRYEEAGRIRDKRDEIRLKKTEISVDLNSLLRQLKEGGVVVIYRCPHCGGKLKIGKDASIDKLRVCEHCGSQIETMDLADFLKAALS